MRKQIKENDLVPQDDTLIKDLRILWALVGTIAPADDFEFLESKLMRMIDKFTPTNYEVISYEGYNIYEKKIPWYELTQLTSKSIPRKIMHAVVTIKAGSGEISVGYNPAQNSLSFKKGNNDLKFYNFKSDVANSAEIFNEFQAIMKRLLR